METLKHVSMFRTQTSKTSLPVQSGQRAPQATGGPQNSSVLAEAPGEPYKLIVLKAARPDPFEVCIKNVTIQYFETANTTILAAGLLV